ncbi:poly(ADP-ribose) glycohydrolase [Elysia marginata]|uniref:poly(ADP-ribose) glycohydrolase n=1 Tax=Elysia marginata TaxID=1093978 RepID=A0AAV4H7I6_9GAST|nr:poly(ADP-ribose) glycohydrolase [Elysia marginata]
MKPTTSATDEYKNIDKSELRCAPDCYRVQLPPLQPSGDHKILFRVPAEGWSDTLVHPYPNTFKDRWDENYVYMPCSNSNIIASQHGPPVSRWKQIEDVLQQGIPGMFELEEAILSYNQHYANRWTFDSLREFFLQPIPLLKQGRRSKLTMSQQQAACLLANAFFCTFPKRNARIKSGTLPDINFSNLYSRSGDPSRKIEKLKCIVNYFERIRNKMPTGILTFTRHVLDEGAAPIWHRCNLNLADLHVSSEGNIEDDGVGMLQADFANKFVGGGVLGHGLVQEEIRFVICPEMILSRLFTPMLKDNEVLFMTGCERFNDYTGYSDSFEYAGDYVDRTQRDAWGRKCTEVVAMDALHFRTSESQFEESKIVRELNKAYCAFQGTEFTSNLPAVCTGNWGCGAFKGDKHLKALIQIMAATMAGRQVCYFTFGDETLQKELVQIHGMLCKNYITVKELYKLISEYSHRVINKKQKYWEANIQTLFEYIANTLGEPLTTRAGSSFEYSADNFESQGSDTSMHYDWEDFKASTP